MHVMSAWGKCTSDVCVYIDNSFVCVCNNDNIVCAHKPNMHTPNQDTSECTNTLPTHNQYPTALCADASV